MSREKVNPVETFEVEDQDEIFEDIMKQVGQKGVFQTRFNIIFNFVFIMLISMPCMSTVLIMTTPDHWCFVPGREETNFTVEQWKQLTLPRNPSENSSFSSCEMYNITQLHQDLESPSLESQRNSTIKCHLGWEYDRKWYSQTVPSQVNWVCDDELKVTNVFSVSRLAETIGTFGFGQLGDTFGRRPVFFISLVFIIAGRIMSIFVADNYVWFLVASVFASFAVSPAFQSPLVISMEVSASESRAHIAMMQNFGWTAGICIMPLLAWLTRDWILFTLVTTLPCVVFLFLYKQFPESPRWLAAKGKPAKCLNVLKYISKVNRTKLPDDAILGLQKLAERKEKTYGMASLLSSWRLARNTIIISLSWIVNGLVYYVLVLNVINMDGNPFLNFFWQSLVELPGSIVGRLLSDRCGRRWVQSGCLLAMVIMCGIIAVTVRDPSLSTLTMALVVFFKFWNTVTFYVVYLQAIEIYPTCVRQSGTACGSLIASIFGVLGPYIVYLGTAYDSRYPYLVLGLLATVGGIATSFLPETLHQKLPETLHDAQHFGEDQPYWQFNYSKVKQEDSSEDTQNYGSNSGYRL